MKLHNIIPANITHHTVYRYVYIYMYMSNWMMNEIRRLARCNKALVLLLDTVSTAMLRGGLHRDINSSQR